MNVLLAKLIDSLTQARKDDLLEAVQNEKAWFTRESLKKLMQGDDIVGDLRKMIDAQI